jgi:hypothetical protein
MMLVGVERSVVGPDLRTLECPKCELAYKALAEDQWNREQSGLAQKRTRPGRVRPPQLAASVFVVWSESGLSILRHDVTRIEIAMAKNFFMLTFSVILCFTAVP